MALARGGHRNERKSLRTPLNFARNEASSYLDVREVSRFLYLDADTVVQEDVSATLDVPLSPGRAVRWSRSCRIRASRLFETDAPEVRDAGVRPKDCYVNAGAFAADLAEWTRRDVPRRVAELARKHAKSKLWREGVQQPSFVLALHNVSEDAPERWNLGALGFNPAKERVPLCSLRAGAVLHWNGAYKPWACGKGAEDRLVSGSVTTGKDDATHDGKASAGSTAIAAGEDKEIEGSDTKPTKTASADPKDATTASTASAASDPAQAALGRKAGAGAGTGTVPAVAGTGARDGAKLGTTEAKEAENDERRGGERGGARERRRVAEKPDGADDAAVVADIPAAVLESDLESPDAIDSNGTAEAIPRAQRALAGFSPAQDTASRGLKHKKKDKKKDKANRGGKKKGYDAGMADGSDDLCYASYWAPYAPPP